MRVFYVHEMLGGSDHEFVVNAYTRLLNRWPDEGGYRHYLARVQGRPDLRRETVIEIGTSEEARNLGITLREEVEDGAEAPPGPALGLQASSARTTAVLAEIEELRRRLAEAGPDEAQAALERAEAGLRRLRAELDALHHDVCVALRQTMRDRLAGR
ncbi:MAG TPA: DUF4214 domain-containing protein [Acetobacteraceae bacterium]|nr:DUF4214 domain-containing protein [Acetobacteraceae bacterium]